MNNISSKFSQTFSLTFSTIGQESMVILFSIQHQEKLMVIIWHQGFLKESNKTINKNKGKIASTETIMRLYKNLSKLQKKMTRMLV